MGLDKYANTQVRKRTFQDNNVSKDTQSESKLIFRAQRMAKM